MSLVEPVFDADDIQGHGLRGFDTDYMWVICLKFGQPAAARTWLKGLASKIDSLTSVHSYRTRRTACDPGTAQQVLLNVALSRFGLDALGFEGTAIGDGLFNLPMGLSAPALGDSVGDYVVGATAATTPDVVLIVGCTDAGAADEAADHFIQEAEAAGLTVLLKDRGNVLPGEEEHFGFRDGISLPGPRGLLPGNPPTPLTLRLVDPADPAATTFAAPGRPLVWPGQFVFGLPKQAPDDLENPGPEAVTAKAAAMQWARNGSLLVFRRLRQDVAAFRGFAENAALAASTSVGRTVSAGEIASAIVGRWPDGTPKTLSPNAPNPAIAGGDRLNHFSYGGLADMRMADGTVVPGHGPDGDGVNCPFFGHIRKVNPRNRRTDQGSAARTLTFQTLRRGIPFGPRFDDDPNAERGLLFLAYQTSFDRQFRVLQRLWMNNADAPEAGGEGHDVLMGRSSTGQRFGAWIDPVTNVKVTIPALTHWVIPTGGAFLFSPSISFFSRL